MIKNRLKKLFIPHEENGYRPDFLERASMGIMLILVLISFAIANIQSLLWMNSNWMVSAVLPSVIVNMTNEEREDEALSSLKRSALLDQAAQLKADDMAEKGYFAHYSPEGVSPWHWFDEVSYNYVSAGENLAVHFNDSGKVVDAWMKSPSHRANIMNGKYTEIGVGTAKGEYKGASTVFVVQLFGTPGVAQSATDLVVTNIETSSTSSVPALASGGGQSTLNDVLGEEAEPVVEPTSEPEIVTEAEQEVVVPTEEVQVPDVATLYSEVATTSSGIIPAIVDESTDSGPNKSNIQTSYISSIVESATQPNVWLQLVYLVLAFIVSVSLIISIVVEWRRQNPLQMAYAGGLLAVMALLFHVHTILTSGITIV